MSKKIAFLVPCYNESKTIEKVVKDCKKPFLKQLFMFMIIIQQMELMKLRKKRELLSAMNTNKVKEMLLGECFEKLKQIVILC